MAKVRRDQVMVAKEMIERGVSIRQVARQLGVAESGLRYRLGRPAEPSSVARPSPAPVTASASTGAPARRIRSRARRSGSRCTSQTLRQLGIEDLTVRLDKGFFSKALVALLTEPGVTFVLKVPDHAWVRRTLSAYRPSEKDATLWTATGELYGARLASVERRTPVRSPRGRGEAGWSAVARYSRQTKLDS